MPPDLTTSSTAPVPTGNDILIPGLWSREGNNAAPQHEWLVIVSAELVSVSDQTLTALYPISVEGPGIGKAVSVDDAEVAADQSKGSLVPPKPLLSIRGHARFEVWIKLSIACRERTFSPRGVRVAIALDGTTGPAVFKFAELFGSTLLARPEPC